MNGRKRVRTTLVLVYALLCVGRATAKNADIGIVSKDTLDGERIYRVTCSVCHGERGDAQSFAARALNPPPRDFTDPDVIRALSRPDMIAAVAEGRAKTAMQPFKEQLSGKQIEAVVDYIRTTFMRAGSGASLEPDLSVGREVYNSRCYMCHGYGGDARTQAGIVLKPKPRSFTDAKRMRTVSAATMIDAVKNGRPGTAMQPFARVLTSHEVASVVAFIRYAFVEEKAGNIRYHSPENGWRDFQSRYVSAIAYFYHQGDDEDLSPDLLRGRHMFDVSCVSCHLPKSARQAAASSLTWTPEAETSEAN